MMRAWVRSFVVLCALVAGGGSAFAKSDTVVPRVVLAVYDSREEARPRDTELHHALELPLNHLGFVVRYQDIRQPLPVLDHDIAGVVVWFNPAVKVPEPMAFLNWLEAQVIAPKRRLVVFGGLGISKEYRDLPQGMAQLNRIFRAVGVRDENRWVEIVYGASIAASEPTMLGYERRLTGEVFPYYHMTLADADARSYLSIQNETEHKVPAHLITSGPLGGYVAHDYALYRIVREKTKDVALQQWLINPFEFLKTTLDVAVAPKPDPTTMLGRRIAYVQMDGDGWNNLSSLLEHRDAKVLAAQAAYEKFLKPYPDIPVSVGVTGAEVDPDCYGVRGSDDVAARIFALPNVEPASHTYSHPVFWQFFANGDLAREKALLSFYPPRPSENISFLARILSFFRRDPWKAVDDKAPDEATRKAWKAERKYLEKYFNKIPRNYACAPFDLDKEIRGNVELLNELVPAGKQVHLLHWSGDTAPFQEALARTRLAGLLNIGGGDLRYDSDYPSLSYLPPYGYIAGTEIQVYAANGNENSIRSEEGSSFSSMRYFPDLAKLTDAPQRLTPLSLYFHAADAASPLSMQAVRENIEYLRRVSAIRLPALHYALQALGFFTSHIETKGPMRWRITNSGSMQTVRFDRMSGFSVDFGRSKGVWGQRYLQGSLYVALDPGFKEHWVALKQNPVFGAYPQAELPYVIESSWQIKSLRKSKTSLIIAAQGYGVGQFVWRMPLGGRYELVTMRQEGKNPRSVLARQLVTVGEDGLLRAALPEANGERLVVRINRVQ